MATEFAKIPLVSIRVYSASQSNHLHMSVTLKFTIEVSLDNNKDTARVSANTPDFKLKGEFIGVKESMNLFALVLGEQ